MKPLLLALLLLLSACALDFQGTRPQSAAAVPLAADMDAAKAKALYLDVIRKLHNDGKSHAALAYLDEYDQRYPGDAAGLLLRADCLLSVGRFEDARQIYLQLLAGKERAAALAGLGNSAGMVGDWSGAAAAYAEAVEASPATASYRNDLGYALLKSGDPARALFTLRQAVELAPRNPLIRNNLIIALSASGHRAEADAMIAAMPEAADRAAVLLLLARHAGDAARARQP